MKKAIFTSILALLISAGTIVKAQERPDEYLGLPGDNLNLYAVMNLFQESETLEGFERKLNEENSRINNLDLNGDNFVDYIMVTDYVDREDHNIVLSVALNNNEKQDVAVFTVQKLRNGEVAIQLIGDEELYGRNYIIEPIYADNNGETPNPGYNRRQNVTVVRTTYYQVAAWPMIRYIYRPDYVIWRSSWHWGYYPSYWHSWSPFGYHYYYGYYSNWYPVYYRQYRHWNTPRYTRYNDFYYTSIRSYSPQVSVRIKEGSYKSTYSRPEQRRDGVALYNKTRASNESRSSGSNATTTQGRRSVSTQSGERNTVTNSNRNNTSTGTRTGTSTGTNRRAATTTTVKSGTNTNSGQSTGTVRRSTTSSSEKAVSKPAPSQRSESGSNITRPAATKEAPTVRTTVRATPNTNRSQTNATSRSSVSSSSGRAASKPAANKSETVNSRTRQSTTKAATPARTTVRPSKKEEKTTTTIKRR